MGPASACALTPEGTCRPEPAWTRAFPGPRRRPVPAPADEEPGAAASGGPDFRQAPLHPHPGAAAMMRQELHASLTFCPQGGNVQMAGTLRRSPQLKEGPRPGRSGEE